MIKNEDFTDIYWNMLNILMAMNELHNQIKELERKINIKEDK